MFVISGAGSPRSPDTTFNYFSKLIRTGSREGDCTDFPDSRRESKRERNPTLWRLKRKKKERGFSLKNPPLYNKVQEYYSKEKINSLILIEFRCV